MNYKLTPISGKKKSNALFRKFLPFLDGETSKLIMTLIAILISSFSNLIAPIIIGTTIDKAIGGKDVHTLLINT